MPSNLRLLFAFGLFVLGTASLLLIAAFAHPAQAAAPTSNGPSVSATCTPYWYATTTQNVGPNNNALTGVAVITAGDVWSVGFYTDTNSIPQTLIQHYDGTAWSIVSSPSPGAAGSYLQAVNALSATDVWAVGYYRNTAGGVPQTLTLHYNGATWSTVSSPNPGSVENYLYGVAAVSASDAWAVGYYANIAGLYRTLTLRYNGTSWSQVSSPSPTLGGAGLRGVVVVSANEVWAVGAQADLTLTYSMYALRWNGSTWSVSSTPGTAGCVLTAVSKGAPGELWAVGGCQSPTFQTNIIRWNGSSWSTVASPNPGTGDNLLGGVAFSAGGAEGYAVGGYNNTGGPTQALYLYWNGSNWTLIPGDQPGTTGNALVAISHHPTVSSQVWAVGSQESGGPEQTLAVRYGFLCDTPTPTPGAATSTPTSTSTSTSISISTSTSTATTAATTVATATGTAVGGTATSTATLPAFTNTPTGTPGSATETPTASPTPCAIDFADVLPDNTFYPFARCLACRNIISGYPCGGPGEPCNPDNDPYFRPQNNVTRGQIAKIVSNAAGFTEPHIEQSFEDVPVGSTFHEFVERLTSREIMSGYACGGPGEPCGIGNRPYFRPNSNATRGQLAKIVSNAAGLQDPVTGQTFEDVPPASTFYDFIERLVAEGVMSGYACGGPGEPCIEPGNRPYFRPGSLVTRGQTSKIVANAFYPDCYTPQKR